MEDLLSCVHVVVETLCITLSTYVIGLKEHVFYTNWLLIT